MKTKQVYNEECEWYDFTISEFTVDLGNNFSYDMLMREIHKNEEVRAYIDDNACISDAVTFECKGLYGNITQETCMSDISDHFRAYDKEEETVGTEADIPWID